MGTKLNWGFLLTFWTLSRFHGAPKLLRMVGLLAEIQTSLLRALDLTNIPSLTVGFVEGGSGSAFPSLC